MENVKDKLDERIEEIKVYADRKAERIFDVSTRQIDNVKRDLAVGIDELLKIISDQKNYIDNLMKLSREYNEIQNERIDSAVKMITKIAIALLILSIAVILK